MQPINITDLNNAKLDVDHIAEVATSTGLTATDRLGNAKPTVRGAVNSLAAFNSRGAFVAGRVYAIKDVYTSGGLAYVALVAHTSAAAVATDVAAGRVAIHQGATREELADAPGASLIGFLQSGAGAVKRTSADKFKEIVSIKDFGAVCDGIADDSVAIQKASDAIAAVGGGVVFYPDGGICKISAVLLRSNVTHMGNALIVQTQTGLSQGGFYKPAGSGSLSNCFFIGLRFDGARVANPGYLYNALISIELGAGETLDGFNVYDTRMQDAQDHFIRVIPTHSTARATNIRVCKNRFITTPAKRSLGGASSPVSMDAFRIEQTWDYGSAGNGYGTVNAKHIWFDDNYCESIRTGGDIKRGASHFSIDNNRTKNMYDCHHSVDGSFHGTVTRNICEVESTYAGPSTYTNFVEVQGEHIDIAGNIGSGGGKVVSGFFVSDYGRPQEGGVGHRSVGVTQRDNRVKDITGNAYRILNGVGCSNVDNYCENVGGHVATVESGAGRTDGTAALVALGCTQSGNSSKNAALGVRFAGTGHVKGFNPDENGQDYLYVPGFAAADTYGNFINAGGYAELNPNPMLETTGTQPNNLKWFESDFYPAVTAASTKPPGVPNAVTLTDDSTAQLRATYVLVPASIGNRVYARSYFRKNGVTTSCGFVVEERDAAGGFLASTFYGTGASPANWTAYMIGHKVANANTAYLRIGYLPAAASNAPTLTGATDVAKLQISRVAIGR